MKMYKYLIVTFLILLVGACDEDKLIETPLDFLSPGISYSTPNDINAALVTNYGLVRKTINGDWEHNYHTGTDLAQGARRTSGRFENYSVDLTPQSYQVEYQWAQYYDIILNSNVILGRIEDVEYLSEVEKNVHIGEAKFFRGFAYRCLVNIFGGVPIILEETKSPKRDYTRATREETINQAIADLEFAADNLPGVTDVIDGKLNNAAALHVLAELYISAGDPDKAIAAATQVIDDSNIALMTSRFGIHADEDGDTYWDLFQKDNQNRSIGNTEGIFVLQTEFLVVGEGSMTFRFEREYGPLIWFLNAPDGQKVLKGATTENGGRPVGQVRGTTYYFHDIWRDGGNWDIDIRNHERSIKRDYTVNNPNSSWFGQKISDFPQSWFDALTEQDTLRDYYPFVTKISTFNDHPAELINPNTGVMVRSAGGTITDWYLMRVAETYLLRAEAYLAKGNKTAAAADINMLRNRAGAIPVLAADVDIDYILDERMRELNFEEARRMTLSRLNLLYERTNAHNTFSTNMEPYNNLFPIPFSEIEKNTLEVLEQNPGYTN